MDTITEEKINHYIQVTEKALNSVRLRIPKDVDLENVGEDFLDMATRYYKDALYFKKTGDFVTSFAALNYAHGFLDAGARLKVFDVKDSNLFATDQSD